MAAAYVKARAPRLDARLRQTFVSHALSVIEDAALAPLFGPGSRAEAPLAGRIATPDGELFVSGQIDRLAVLEDQVLVADFKTTARPPREGEPAPQSYVTQLALYRLLLREIYPEKPRAGLPRLDRRPCGAGIVRRRARCCPGPYQSGVRPSRCLIPAGAVLTLASVSATRSWVAAT